MKSAIPLCLAFLLLAGVSGCRTPVHSAAPCLLLAGEGRLEFITPPGIRVVETARLTLRVQGNVYDITSISTTATGVMMTNRFRCDGVHTFLPDGEVIAGRFPGSASTSAAISPVVQAVWLAYGSAGYFAAGRHQTGLPLTGFLSWSPCNGVTNQVVNWPGTTLPRAITGWSSQVMDAAASAASLSPDQSLVLFQYPHGFKRWQFTAADPVRLGGGLFPRRFTLEGFLPEPPEMATTGDATVLARRVSFTARSLTLSAP